MAHWPQAGYFIAKVTLATPLWQDALNVSRLFRLGHSTREAAETQLTWQLSKAARIHEHLVLAGSAAPPGRGKRRAFVANVLR